MRGTFRIAWALWIGAMTVQCTGRNGDGDAGSGRSDAGVADAGPTDGGTLIGCDGGACVADAGRADAGSDPLVDAGDEDAASSVDAGGDGGVEDDAGFGADAGDDGDSGVGADAGDAPRCGVATCVDGGFGLAICDEGATRNRAAAIACPALPPPPEPGSGTGCTTHAECATDTYCVVVDGYVLGGEGEQETECASPCEVDDDCGAGSACLCAHHGNFNTCIPAACRTADDCDGAPCGIGRPLMCSPELRLDCRLQDVGCTEDGGLVCERCGPTTGGVWLDHGTGDCD